VIFLYSQTCIAFWWSWADEAKFNLSHVLELEQTLSSRVIEQPYAVKAVANMMIAYQAGIHDSNRPIGSLLFIGTTGVGKTELAKALTNEIVSNLDQFTHLNMSEFSAQEAGIYRLIGAPWSYRDSEKGGELSNAILANPYSVVLLDEFEKANSDVRLLFLHIFDEGYFTTPKGEYVDCKNCIFIATTNVGSTIIKERWRRGLSYDEVMNCIEPELISKFTPELYGRMQPVLFQDITDLGLTQIIHIKLKEVTSRLKERRNIEVTFNSSVVEYVFSQCHEHDGARSVIKLINRDVLVAIAKALIENPYKEGDRLFVLYDGSAIRVSPS
jgi:ATP-dependent Clp protease ATP-binding subunit ClpB